MAGALAAGVASDKWGRTLALALTCLPFALGWALIAAGSGASGLFTGRLLTGFGQGAFLNVVPVYIAETAPAQLRGTLGGVNQLGINVGLVAAFALGLPIVGLTWRQLAWTALVPTGMLALCALVLMPESPRWLVQTGRGADAGIALRVLRPPDADVARELGRINAALAAAAAEPPLGWADFTKPALAKPLRIVLIMMVLQQLTGASSGSGSGVMHRWHSIHTAYADPSPDT